MRARQFFYGVLAGVLGVLLGWGWAAVEAQIPQLNVPAERMPPPEYPKKWEVGRTDYTRVYLFETYGACTYITEYGPYNGKLTQHVTTLPRSLRGC
jgi:hypothetical protein